jgi:hypothetical protein
MCGLCADQWQAEHGKKRRAARVAIRALKAFERAGGWLSRDGVKLVNAAQFFSDALGTLLDQTGAFEIDLPLSIGAMQLSSGLGEAACAEEYGDGSRSRRLRPSTG